MSSGAARDCPASAARAVSPSGPSSPSAGARTLASTTTTVVPDGLHRGTEGDRPAGPSTCPLENLLDGRGCSLCDEPAPQVCLQGLIRLNGTPAEHRVGVLRH